MQPAQSPYSQFALCQDMWDSVRVFRSFDPFCTTPFVEALRGASVEGVLLTGEGSSRIFPAKRAIYHTLQNGPGIRAPGEQPLGRYIPLYTEGATQALEYNLKGCAVFGASNSGRTKEVVRLFQVLHQSGHPHLYGVTAHAGSPLEELSARAYVLQCGKEGAVAATKSVMEQALFYHALFYSLQGSALAEAARKLEHVLSLELDREVVHKLAQAETLYFAGRNNGVGEELTLKTNEITRKKSDFLEGTYAVHGIEEVMNPKDAVVLVDPFPQEEEKFREVLVKGVGCYVCAIASRFTSFPTILIPEGGLFQNYLELAAGWNLLVEIGLTLGINLDKPVRARKVGNEIGK